VEHWAVLARLQLSSTAKTLNLAKRLLWNWMKKQMLKSLPRIVRVVQRLVRDLVFVGPAVVSTMRVLNLLTELPLRVKKIVTY